MTVRAEPFSIPIVRGVVRPYAIRNGLTDADTERFLITVEEAMAQVIEYGFPGNPDATFDVSASVDDVDFKVVIRDKGIPYDYEYLSRSEESATSMCLLNGFADKVQMKCLGTEGREQTLVKHLTALPEFRDSQLEGADSDDGDDSDEPALGPSDMEYVLLKREYAMDVAQCIYDEFGYSYVHEVVYYPDEFYEATLRGECISMVAVAPNGEVAGHLSLVGSPAFKGTMELGMGVVKKKYRKCSIMSALTEKLMDHAHGIGLTSINAQPVTYHVFTQKICNKQGMHPCAFAFNIISSDLTTSFDSGFRGDQAIAVCPLRDEHRTIYVDPRVLPIVEYVVGTGGFDREVVVDRRCEPEGDSDITMDICTRLEAGTIFVNRTGADILSELRVGDHYIRSQRCMVSRMFINICDPCSVRAYEAARTLGYICTGLFPGCSDNDYLMMESVIYSVVEYDKVRTVEPFTGLLELVKAGDVDE